MRHTLYRLSHTPSTFILYFGYIRVFIGILMFIIVARSVILSYFRGSFSLLFSFVFFCFLLFYNINLVHLNLFVCLFVCLFYSVSFFSIYLSIYLSIYPFSFIYLFVCLFIHCLVVSLFFLLCIYLFIFIVIIYFIKHR